MKKRISKPVIQAVTQEQFSEALAVFAAADAAEAAINAKMDEQFTKIREKNAEEVTALQKKKEEALVIAETYCKENKERLFSEQRSMDTLHGQVGFRTGTPALKTLKGFNWISVLELVKIHLPAFVRRKEEVDKESILASRNEAEMIEVLPKIGVEVAQDEKFFITLKKEEAALV